MIQKPEILNWHREEHAKGLRQGIPDHVLQILDEQAKEQAPKKDKNKDSKVKEAE